MKPKPAKPKWNFNPKLGFTSVFLSCSFFFVAGLFASDLISQDFSGARQRARQLQSLKEEIIDYDLLTPGMTGDDSITLIPFQVLSWKPRALYFPNFATAEQCERIINMAKPSLKPSTLALRKGETEDNTKGIRTSSGMFISASEDNTGVLDAIEEKIARATMLPRVHGEAFNVLRYEIGQKYNSHYDAFNPAEYGPQKSQRNGLEIDENYDFQKCIGLQVKPRQGDGLLFYSLFPNNTIDPTSLHGSCPVIKGEKWVATKWIRDQELDE
ncbi:probable prolyl 4-hydroxylase 9 isoform X2 [Hevea brasiliensis]|uniref:probable prolyl 4-hydroxylase 9 isoform X2 n=1 Tax=Hevea brasiliensis TaxID=3981 RepID=UPI0025F1A25E|nr:probable prolyl 4-hydroxylase 9 isoform X2 [Hevea brasiliensis]